MEEQPTSLKYPETNLYQGNIKTQAIKQLIKLLKTHKDLTVPPKEALFHGIEVESHLVKRDPETNRIVLDCQTDHLFDQIIDSILLMPEVGKWMIEAIPEHPFTSFLGSQEFIDFYDKLTLKTSGKDFPQLLLACQYPSVGTPQFNKELGDPNFDNQEELKKANTVSKSSYFSDKPILEHFEYFRAYCENSRLRKGGEANNTIVPIFQDSNTIKDSLLPGEKEIGGICFDTMFITNITCSQQITFASQTLREARFVYDCLHTLSPIIGALSPGSPICKGYLLEDDCIWRYKGAMINSITKDEQEAGYVGRLAPCSFYISQDARNKPEIYNDKNVKIDQVWKDQLILEAKKAEMEFNDPLMIDFMAQMLQRDILNLYKNDLKDDPEEDPLDSWLAEFILKTTWTDIKLKFPPKYDPKSTGFRVEFRQMDLQQTKEQNTSILTFVKLLHRIITEENSEINFYVPISKVDINFDRYPRQDAALNQKFFWRTNMFDEGVPKVEEMTILEIFEGKQDNSEFKGLFWVIEQFLERNSSKIAGEELEGMRKAIGVVRKVVAGEIPTCAKFIRNFVKNHDSYKNDSKMSEQCMYDLSEYLMDSLKQN